MSSSSTDQRFIYSTSFSFTSRTNDTDRSFVSAKDEDANDHVVLGFVFYKFKQMCAVEKYFMIADLYLDTGLKM